MALGLMKKLMCEQSSLSDEAKAAVSDPEAGLAELHEVVGHDHWVVTPCHRTSLGAGSGGRVMEGYVLPHLLYPCIAVLLGAVNPRML